MSEGTVQVDVKTAFSLAIAIVGLVMLIFVAWTAFQLATGAIKPLRVDIQSGWALQGGYDALYGIILQIGMFLVIVLIGFILLRTGLKIILHKGQ